MLVTLATLFFVGVTTQTAAAAPKKPTTHVTGKTEAGTPVKGTYKIKKFAVEKGELVAKGTFTGTLGQDDDIVKKAVTIPVGKPDGAAARGLAAQDVQAQAVCDILHLQLGPLDLNLLGLRVQLNQVNLDITAIPGAGNLLGNLLCAVAGLLDGPSLPGLNQIIADLLNLILANNV